MGTRSRTCIIGHDNRPIVCVYRQFDGYPAGMGQDLCNLLASTAIVNGHMLDMDWPRYANGMGCLAASLIADLKCNVPTKDFKPHIGNVSCVPHGAKSWGEEYLYHVYMGPVSEEWRDATFGTLQLPRLVEGIVYVACWDSARLADGQLDYGKPLFNGPAWKAPWKDVLRDPDDE